MKRFGVLPRSAVWQLVDSAFVSSSVGICPSISNNFAMKNPVQDRNRPSKGLLMLQSVSTLQTQPYKTNIRLKTFW